jgi:hypothetical protein
MSGIPSNARRLTIALVAVAVLSMMFAGTGALAAPDGCQAAGADSASCSFIASRPSTIQIVAVGAQFWEVDVTIGSSVSVCAFGRTGAAVSQCVVSAGSGVHAFVRQGAIIVQRVPNVPSLP